METSGSVIGGSSEAGVGREASEEGEEEEEEEEDVVGFAEVDVGKERWRRHWLKIAGPMLFQFDAPKVPLFPSAPDPSQPQGAEPAPGYEAQPGLHAPRLRVERGGDPGSRRGRPRTVHRHANESSSPIGLSNSTDSRDRLVQSRLPKPRLPPFDSEPSLEAMPTG